MIYASILLNESDRPAKWLHGYEPGDRLELRFSYPVIESHLFVKAGDGEACEQAFHLFNAPVESLSVRERAVADAYRQRGLRSLSVGDVVCITRHATYEVGHPRIAFHACESTGFTRMDEAPEFVPVGVSALELPANLAHTRMEVPVLS